LLFCWFVLLCVQSLWTVDHLTQDLEFCANLVSRLSAQQIPDDTCGLHTQCPKPGLPHRHGPTELGIVCGFFSPFPLVLYVCNDKWRGTFSLTRYAPADGQGDLMTIKYCWELDKSGQIAAAVGSPHRIYQNSRSYEILTSKDYLNFGRTYR